MTMSDCWMEMTSAPAVVPMTFKPVSMSTCCIETGLPAQPSVAVLGQRSDTLHRVSQAALALDQPIHEVSCEHGGQCEGHVMTEIG